MATASQPLAPIDDATFASYRKILLLSGPLILSHMGVMLMQIVDGLFLARYSKDAIAALGPAGMTFWLICGLFIGLVGYTNTFVAQYVGANRPDRVGAVIWQGIYMSLLAGALLALASFGANWFFTIAGHAPEIRADEVTYFSILCYGGVATILSAALSGFYAGRSDNTTLMVAHLTGNIVNALLAYALIFGRLGLPELGIRGAAWATVIAQICQVLIMGILLFTRRYRDTYRTWADRHLDLSLIGRMCVYGFPNGIRYILEILAWDVFMLLLGRVSSDGLAATNIVFRLNGAAFFPVIGLATAVSMLVGQAQGASRPDLARKVTYRGLALGQVWMSLCAALMLLIPALLLKPFFDASNGPIDQNLHDLCVKLLWFVAAYTLLDGVNIVFMSVLTGTGDTRFMLIASGLLHLLLVGILLLLVHLGFGTYALWTAATLFICCVSVVWVIRFRSGRWESKRVIEHTPPDIAEAPATSAPL